MGIRSLARQPAAPFIIDGDVNDAPSGLVIFQQTAPADADFAFMPIHSSKRAERQRRYGRLKILINAAKHKSTRNKGTPAPMVAK
jgi:hypothetical protein